MLDRIKEALGLASVEDEHERRVLREEYKRLEAKIRNLRSQLGTVRCSSCPKEEDPRAQRLISRLRRFEDRQDEIEQKLGEAPANASGAESKRRARAGSG